MERIVRFSADITAADTERRTIVGTVVPYGVDRVNTSLGPVIFQPGSHHGRRQRQAAPRARRPPSHRQGDRLRRRPRPARRLLPDLTDLRRHRQPRRGI